jgi:diacylglycerol kinase (ATP)
LEDDLNFRFNKNRTVPFGCEGVIFDWTYTTQNWKIMPSVDRNWVVILRNPKAGATSSQGRVDRLAASLRHDGLIPEVHTNLAMAAKRAEELHQAGRLRVLVGVGGDGTAAELVNRTGKGLPLALLPAGNSNLLARYMKMPSDPDRLSRAIAVGRFQRWDAGRAGDRIFLLMASCGLDAEVVQVLHNWRDGHMTSRHYLKPIWDALCSYSYPELRIFVDENAVEGGATPDLVLRWISVFNLPCYGWQLHFAPQADGQDSQLDLCGFCRGSRLRGFGYLAAMLLRQHSRLSDWTARRIHRMRITADQPVPYQLDGDPGGFLPLEIEILPQRLTMLSPSD